MMKKKLTALVAVLLVCLLLFPTAAFAPQTEKTLRLRHLRHRTLMPSRLPIPPKRWETQNRQMIRKTPHFLLIRMS